MVQSSRKRGILGGIAFFIILQVILVRNHKTVFEPTRKILGQLSKNLPTSDQVRAVSPFSVSRWGTDYSYDGDLFDEPVGPSVESLFENQEYDPEDVPYDGEFLAPIQVEVKEDKKCSDITFIRYNNANASLEPLSIPEMFQEGIPHGDPGSLIRFMQSEHSSHLENMQTKETREINSGGLWIAWVGDSLLRSVFQKAVSGIAGNFELTKRAHNLQWYHVDTIMCCKDIRPLVKTRWPEGERGGCWYGRRGFEFDESVRNVVSGYLRGNNTGYTLPNEYEGGPLPVCVSWQWSQFPDDALVERLNDLTSSQDGSSASPDGIVINPGLHAIMEGWSETSFASGIDKVFKTARNLWTRGRIVLHDITFLIEKDLPSHKQGRLTNARASQFNKILESSANEYGIETLPVSELTRNGDVVPFGDGIHYTGGYQGIVRDADYAMLLAPDERRVRFCHGNDHDHDADATK